MIPPVLPRRAKATFTALENAWASYAAVAAKDQRSPATRKARSERHARCDRTIYEALHTWGVPVTWEAWGGARLVGAPAYSSRAAWEKVDEMFPGWRDRGNEIGNRIAVERKRKNGARVRATLARKKSRRSGR